MKTIYEIASNVCENNMDEIKSAIKRIIELDYVVKNEGLLAMESFGLEEVYPEKAYVDIIIGYIVDGCDWKDVEGFLENRLLMMESNKKRYLCFIYKECLKIIQTGKFSYLKKDCICALVPEKYQSDISNYVDDVDQTEFSKWNEIKNQRIEKEYSKISIDFPLEIVELMRSFETTTAFKSEDFFTQTWLRHMDYSNVYVLMLAGSDEFKEIMLSNMSSRMKMLAKEEIVNLASDWDSSKVSMIREVVFIGLKVFKQISD